MNSYIFSTFGRVGRQNIADKRAQRYRTNRIVQLYIQGVISVFSDETEGKLKGVRVGLRMKVHDVYIEHSE
jgi:hypothetical protein